MKRCKVSTREELEQNLGKHDRSLDWERRAFFETQMYYGWLQTQVKIEDSPEHIEKDRRNQLLKQYLDRLRQSTPIWTVFDDQPGGLEGTPAAKTDSPPPINPSTTEKLPTPGDASPTSKSQSGGN